MDKHYNFIYIVCERPTEQCSAEPVAALMSRDEATAYARKLADETGHDVSLDRVPLLDYRDIS